MAFEGVFGSVDELISVLPADVSDKALELILILKAVSIAAIIYILYVVVMGFLTYRRMRKVEHIEKKADAINRKVNAIDRKLDKLLKKKR